MTGHKLQILFVLNLVAAYPQPDLSVTSVLRQSGDLTAAQISRVVAAIPAAWSGKTFHVRGLGDTGTPEMEMLMAADGRPRYVWLKDDEAIAVEDYTRRPARSCDGKPLSGEFVIEYSSQNLGKEWTTEAFNFSTPDAFYPFYEVLDQRLESGPLASIDGHLARALVGPRMQAPSVASTAVAPDKGQTLWVDVDTLFPVRWEIMYQGRSFGIGYSFRYEPQIRIGPPAGVAAPTCVRLPQNRPNRDSGPSVL